ncbi:MAG: hypothetical protein JXL20_05645 [Deltaproteobacteria bacterium]|nr:hypothetical protein [Deltaproteobacteria bacterium]
MTGLSAGTTYYVRAYATNTAGTAYGNEISFTTSPQAPTVTTQAVTGIGATTATGNGNITDLGAPNPTAHGVVWNTTGTPTTADNSTNEGVAGAIGAFTSNIAGLSPGTIYYVRAYATNTAGTAYGSDVSFITTPQLPVANEVSATVAYNSSNNPIALNITGGTPTSVAVASPASHGTATAGGTSITYTPTAGYSGSDSFTYTASNAGGTSAPATVTITVIDDSDGDGLPDWEEQGPDGNDPNYDGNGDGIPDWKQSNVSSFHTNTPNGEIHYISLAIPSDQRIEYVYVPRVFADPPPEGVSFPYGFFSFTLTGIPAGGTTTMTIYLDGPPPQTYYKYGKTPDNPQDHWYEFSYDGQTGAAVVGNTFVLHLIDGKRGDHDLEANGRIVDPGGPAEIEPHEGLYFPYLVSTGEEKTEIEIINIENYTSTSTISYYGENGDLIKTDTITLGPQGKATISSDNIPQNSASAIVSGDGDPLGYTRYVNTQGKRCAWPAGTSVQKFLSVPHTAVNAEWATALSFFNPGDESVEVTLVYESGASGTFTLNARSRRFLRLAEGESVVSISSTGYISGMEMFDSRISGGDAAALLLRECSLNALYVPSILHGSGEFTGIGLKSHYNGTVNVTGHSATGETEEISFGTQPLGTQTSQSRMAFNMSGILGDDNLWAKIFGEADFSTPVGTPLLHFQGLAVYGKEHTGKLGAVHMNALKFREGFIGIPSTASEITVALLNPGTAEATVAMTGFNASGEALADSTIKIAAGSTWTGAAGDLLNDGSIAGMTHLRIVSDVDLCGFETISTGDRTEMLPVMGRE